MLWGWLRGRQVDLNKGGGGGHGCWLEEVAVVETGCQGVVSSSFIQPSLCFYLHLAPTFWLKPYPAILSASVFKFICYGAMGLQCLLIIINRVNSQKVKEKNHKTISIKLYSPGCSASVDVTIIFTPGLPWCSICAISCRFGGAGIWCR